MKAMIMAAGLGTRLLPLTEHISKPMVPILNRPVIEHIVRLLAAQGFTELAANLHWQPREIRDHLGDGGQLGVRLRYAVEAELSGTAGGVGLFRDFLGDHTFVVISGDALTDIDLAAFLRAHRASGALATMAVKRVADPSRFGVVVHDAGGRVTAFQEKPARHEARSNLCNCGIYAFEPRVFDYIPVPREGEFIDFALHVFPRLLDEHERLFVWRLETYWSDIGSLDQYRGGNFDALQQHIELDLPATPLRPGVWVGEGAEVSPRALLEPPVLIGAGSRVAAGALISGPAVLGEACQVQAEAVVERSVLWRGTEVGEGAVVSRALVGRGVSIGRGASLGTGVVVADQCIIGPAVALPPGVTLAPETTVEAGDAAP